ncbi:MAG: MFS transporter [Planctomycetota bacterium]
MASPVSLKNTAVPTLSHYAVLATAGVILVSHFAVDVYSGIVPALLGVIEAQYAMPREWAAILLGVGSICSGLAQPLFAWISDRANSRIFGALGLLIGAVAISFIGYVSEGWMVFVVYAIGMIGIGMFHPVAVSTIGRLAGQKRSMAISLFFVFGMAGITSGSLIGPWIASGGGTLRDLSLLCIPGILMVALLQFAIGRIDHNPQLRRKDGQGSSGYDIRSIAILYVASALRFLVNMAFVYLLLRWLQHHVAAANPQWSIQQVADYAADLNGRQLATMTIGMAIGGLTAGWSIKQGSERLPLILVPLLFSPAIFALSRLQPGTAALVMCFLSGAGFASMVPVSVSVAQRMMPYHTSLASGLMLGGAWSIACLGPSLAQWLISSIGLPGAMTAVGCILATSGLVTIGIRSDSISDSAGDSE